MRIAVLGASGATGRLLVQEALDRGLEVTAIARDPGRIPLSDRPGLTKAAADVHDPDSLARAVVGSDVLLSGLGNAKGDVGTLTAGAKAAVASGVPRVIWLGAYGSGQSARAAGALTRTLLAVFMRAELADKVAADVTVLAAGGTVFHAGPLGAGPLSPTRCTLPLDKAPKRLFPATVSRSTVAAAMLDEALTPRFPGQTVIPVDHAPRR
ncbi:NAD(P)H-binding protein [Kutzneria sp. NPDC051319]|uniref:NAD(P)-dependent oxidoreductase n=1 Tax=Kutzneria sp. NPDC051319 TaxID=3155047 RepID=UPI0034424391